MSLTPRLHYKPKFDGSKVKIIDIKETIRKLMYTLKKRKLFGDFLASYSLCNKIRTDEIDSFLSTLSHSGAVEVDDLLIRYQYFKEYNANYKSLYKEIVVILYIIKDLRGRKENDLLLKDIFRYYIEDEIERRGDTLKRVPNEMEFVSCFAAIFSIFGIFSCIALLGFVFNFVVSIACATFIGIILFISRIILTFTK